VQIKGWNDVNSESRRSYPLTISCEGPSERADRYKGRQQMCGSFRATGEIRPQALRLDLVDNPHELGQQHWVDNELLGLNKREHVLIG